jgi:hypothetical protein
MTPRQCVFTSIATFTLGFVIPLVFVGSLDASKNRDANAACAAVPEGAILETLELSGSPASSACFVVLGADAAGVEVQCTELVPCWR